MLIYLLFGIASRSAVGWEFFYGSFMDCLCAGAKPQVCVSYNHGIWISVFWSINDTSKSWVFLVHQSFSDI